MSWPTDGEPRFVVRENTGYPIGRHHATTGSGSREGLSVHVADRAYAWRPVRAWRSEDLPGSYTMTRVRKFATIRGWAADLAAELNAKHG